MATVILECPEKRFLVYEGAFFYPLCYCWYENGIYSCGFDTEAKARAAGIARGWIRGVDNG